MKCPNCGKEIELCFANGKDFENLSKKDDWEIAEHTCNGCGKRFETFFGEVRKILRKQ